MGCCPSGFKTDISDAGYQEYGRGSAPSVDFLFLKSTPG